MPQHTDDRGPDPGIITHYIHRPGLIGKEWLQTVVCNSSCSLLIFTQHPAPVQHHSGGVRQAGCARKNRAEAPFPPPAPGRAGGYRAGAKGYINETPEETN
ncbi:hypothetical protein ASZ90_010706 [hydrocarbon metagenome]|uniref:Uncharacterized protein n=1 Tax=hydrocarbon metagenome TaxID=938273 RepID=A0A0W8FFC7_9ZZZZ